MTENIKLIGDQGDADAFVAAYGDRFRYVHHWHKFASWDGRRWDAEGGDTGIRALWQEHLRDQVRAALESGKSVKGALKKVGARCGSHNESAVIQLCRARTMIDFREFDALHLALNVQNGIVDLSDGTLHAHDPDAYLTRLAPVEWQPGATCPEWEKYLLWAMQGDAECVGYLQRFFGLCLTGDAEHELAHFFWGGGGNGKTTVVKTIEDLLGDYACRAPARLLMQRKHEAHPTELALLCGRRVVVLAETNENQTLDEQQLKVVASKDAISARRMREDFWNFKPTHKAILLTNNRPRIRGQDEGVWRRVRLLEWGASVSEEDKDPHFGDRFTPELPGILQWAFAGLQQALRTGLRPPEKIQKATAEYRNLEDSVARWVRECCIAETNAESSASLLHETFLAWAKNNWETCLAAQSFGKRLAALRIPSRVSHGRTLYKLVVRPPQQWSAPAPSPQT